MVQNTDAACASLSLPSVFRPPLVAAVALSRPSPSQPIWQRRSNRHREKNNTRPSRPSGVDFAPHLALHTGITSIPTTTPSLPLPQTIHGLLVIAEYQCYPTNDHKTRQRAGQIQDFNTPSHSLQPCLSRLLRYQPSRSGAERSSRLLRKAKMILDLWKEILYRLSMPATEAGGLGNLGEMPAKWATFPQTS